MKNLRWIIGPTAFGFIILYILGFRIEYNPALKNDWDAISAVGTWIGVIATIAIAISLENSRKAISPTIKFIGFNITDDNPYLVITNTGERPIIISQISFVFGKYSFGRINAEDYNDIGSVTADHYIVKPYEIAKIDLPLMLFQSQIAEYHNGDRAMWEDFIKERENELLKISIREISGKYYTEKTNLNLKQYIEIVMK
jgi:hypothetical protein